MGDLWIYTGEQQKLLQHLEIRHLNSTSYTVISSLGCAMHTAQREEQLTCVNLLIAGNVKLKSV